ncbi:phosphatase PAP2 family protein [Paraglaciecola aquimarina]|uniref:undecaprenyl-diphosphate phosphatase n=1 Tax=Paraglaciecola algarum TaxID=3050085 RepID=A0ABS9D2Z1_9ALTE|nr:phosphatase PAP2 family protein [Paraglaciecola sp. G1-23]MCF2947293.1 phosphatase PAP2 family protein [Paraglaciecola sp. G1-23]
MRTLAQSDKAIFYWVFNLMAERDCRWIKLISKTGDGQLYLLIGGLLWWLEPQHGALFLYAGLLAYAFEIPIYLILKRSLKRQRPCDCLTNLNAHIVPSDKFSLPSGHTAAAFLMASLISHFYPALSIFAYFWATCVGCSRVLLGVHYPGDIIAGAALGLGISTLNLSIF